MKRWFWLCLFVGCVLALCIGSASATPSFNGYTGLLVVPTADALADDAWNAGIFMINLKDLPDVNQYTANLGVADGLEVGFTKINPDDEVDEDTFLNSKYRFAVETEQHPALAVGIIDATDEVDTTVYVVASKSFTRTITTRFGEITSPRLSVGVGGGMLDGFFAGASVVLGDRLTLMLEYDSDDINWGARLALDPSWRIHFGAFDGLDDIGFGISYNRGF